MLSIPEILHARGIIACDFLVVVTATFRLLYVFVVIEHRSRRTVLKSPPHCPKAPHYNAGRPHMALGPGIPDPPPALRDQQKASSRRRREESYAVHAKSILAGLHHEYSFAPACA
jgi:hypothetical protein